ncbi:hypothetical protein SKDZ_13G3780 [Saccharomyces kudriavzevii ZP591]|uniref:YMR252C-like protein n=1 Tax=Saccharomyces cerevisiae x Saccharomyces kudriavzevii (strain VIN7) TaxID=1095631 RepID=H0GZM3_SACCK|nr:YMR252C-like protein [Saccharomyces cerevisiae x Saccharomyces kudriavzevii VIN7]CAI4048811.1 hypothetical protein SKDZ_13G3780 [Saccharomyces kudriavzevii ZP591]
MFGKVFVSYIRTRIGFKPLSTIYTPSSSSSHGFGKEACFPYKKWHELDMLQKQEFIQRFVKNYRHQYPSSKTNVSLKGLSIGMDEHNDSPSVFGIFYNDIWKSFKSEQREPGNDGIRTGNRFSHPRFKQLLIQR